MKRVSKLHDATVLEISEKDKHNLKKMKKPACLLTLRAKIICNQGEQVKMLSEKPARARDGLNASNLQNHFAPRWTKSSKICPA